ncbi:MAG TPA: hypothetical protein P5181_07170 [Dermatophilaceae bacterium]|nr:hypothetical protein [Dermatophilaceae bacterium]
MEDDTYDVHVFGIRAYRGKVKTTYTVRWRVASQTRQRTFDTDSYRSTLVSTMRAGQPFSAATGLPATPSVAPLSPGWLDHASAFVDSKWPQASPRHRKGIAEGLTTATEAMLTPSLRTAEVRKVLRDWAFNTAARDSRPLREAGANSAADMISELPRRLPTVSQLADPAQLRPVLDALGRNLDGSPASPSTTARKRSALYSALGYAVELGHLPSHPMDRIAWRRAQPLDVVDRRVVVNPQQAASLLQAVSEIYPSLEAFFACIYYAAMRPAEVRHLTTHDLSLPAAEIGWGTLLLTGSTQTSGARWTDTGNREEDRQLKHRPARSIREVPAPPGLVDTLRTHITRFPPGVGGRLFVTRAGAAGVPVAPPFASPQSMGIVYRVWDLARRQALTDAEYHSPLAKRPYDLRHAAVSLWLNAGVPATQVAEWAGHSVNVLLRVYAACVVGQDSAARARVDSALRNALSPSQAPISPLFPH